MGFQQNSTSSIFFFTCRPHSSTDREECSIHQDYVSWGIYRESQRDPQVPAELNLLNFLRHLQATPCSTQATIASDAGCMKLNPKP
jgi:hypothetical protein